MIFYDFEVFSHDWLAVFADTGRKVTRTIINSPEELKALYEANKTEIWVGFNNRHYDQYIFKGILLGMDPKDLNDRIIILGQEGWQISGAFNDIPMINYDVMPNPPVGLKTMEGFMGSDIKETEVPFNINRKLTPEELRMIEYYCMHDVGETYKVFLQTIDNFNAMFGIIKAFPDRVSLWDIGSSEARITSKVLGCSKHDYNDEFDVYFFPCLKLSKYKYVQDWFERKLSEARSLKMDDYAKRAWYKSPEQNLVTDVAGIPHSFGFGGLHGAPDHPIHATGQILHVDVNNYYPSMLIAWDIVTRSATNDNYTKIYQTRKAMKMKQLAAKTREEAKEWKKKQLPYKKMLNALSGAMKDKTNAAYDPRNNNCMCINGQLMLLDLIEHLEVVEGFELIQSNTDGLIVKIPDTDEAFNQVDDICYDWECRCSTDKCDIKLALDNISEVYQKDVNNYLWIDADGGTESIGAYLKPLSPIDNDLPILNKAVTDYMVKKIPVVETIRRCDDLLMFQKLVKLTDKYDHVEHEEGKRFPSVRKNQPDRYDDSVKYTYKSYRVFASRKESDGRLVKVRANGKKEKFGNTPDHCFIFNDSCEGVKVPDYLDRQWYITRANERLRAFGL